MTDLLLNTDLGAKVQNGDFVTGESTEQHQQLLLESNKGDFKENPTVCVGAAGWLKDEGPSGLLAEIKKEFERDGMTVKNISLTGENLSIDAHY